MCASLERFCSVTLAGLALVPLLGFATPAAAQIYESVGIRAQGMGGAFVAVADDATATWWNPAGLANGAYLNGLIEGGHRSGSSPGGSKGFAIAFPALGLSYYRLTLNGIQAPTSTETEAANRQDEGVLSVFGATMGQSIGEYLVVATTLKVMHVVDHTQGDLDLGAMVAWRRARFGLAVKNLTEPASSDSPLRVTVPRQVRAGAALGAGPAGHDDLKVAFDADLTTTSTPDGRERHVSAGAEAWVLGRRVGVRGGVAANTIDGARPSGSTGLSLAVRPAMYAEGQVTWGADRPKNGWSLGLRVTY